MSTNSYERGTSPLRLEWIEETTVGQVPDNPAWELFSDNIISAWDWEPDANTQRQSGAGEIEAQGFFNGSETHEASFEYHLQQWYVDGSNNTVDPGGDFLRPGSDNSLRNTHAVVSRSEVDSGGADSAGIRNYVVGKGGHPGSITVPFETEDGSPINQTLEYQFEKIRRYSIDQPSSSTTLDVVSSDSGDTSQTLTIENEGASTTESVTLNGTTTVTTTASFGDIDAAELDSETAGDVTISDGNNNDLMVIQGQNSYPAGEGDLGVPALGTGSHASAIGTSYVRFLDDTLSVPNINNSYEIVSGELSADTGLDDNTQTETAKRNIHATEFAYTFTASVAGETANVDQVVNYLTENTGTITWTADEGSIDGSNAFIQSPGTYTKESGNGKMIFDNEWSAESLTLSN